MAMFPQKYGNSSVVDFSDFVSFLLSGGTRDNDHVRPQTSICAVCSLTYDVIGKAETFELDSQFILPQIGLSESSDLLHQRYHSSGGPTEVLTRRYLASLTPSQQLALNHYYRRDFEAFGYDPQEYL